MMKFLLVTVSVIAVFTAECQALRNEPLEDRFIPDGGKGQVEIEGGQNRPDGRDISLPATQLGENQTSSEDQPLYGESEGHGEAVDLENLPARRGILIPATQLGENQTSSEGSNPDHKDHQMKVGDKFELQKAKPICKSALGGRCRPSNVDCRKGELESTYGKPYCQNNNRRCCYPGACPKGGWEENNGNCFYFSSSVGVEKSWEESKTDCENRGEVLNLKVGLAELGIPDNCQSDVWLMETIAAKGKENDIYVWLGGHKSGGEWTWVTTGRTLSIPFPYWGPTQPSGDGDCLDAWPHGNKGRFYLNDQHCQREIYYVCQVFN